MSAFDRALLQEQHELNRNMSIMITARTITDDLERWLYLLEQRGWVNTGPPTLDARIAETGRGPWDDAGGYEEIWVTNLEVRLGLRPEVLYADWEG